MGFPATNPEAGKSALRLANVRKNFGPTAIIRGVTLDVIAGERHAIIGPNGAGKSTLFNLISGRFAPSAGSIKLQEEEIAGKSPFAIYRRGLAAADGHHADGGIRTARRLGD